MHAQLAKHVPEELQRVAHQAPTRWLDKLLVPLALLGSTVQLDQALLLPALLEQHQEEVQGLPPTATHVLQDLLAVMVLPHSVHPVHFHCQALHCAVPVLQVATVDRAVELQCNAVVEHTL